MLRNPNTLKKSFEESPADRMLGGRGSREKIKHKKRWFDEQDPHEVEERLDDAQGDEVEED